MSFTRTQLVIIATGGLIVLIVIGLFVFGGNKRNEVGLTGKVTFWGVFDDQRVIDELIGDYNRLQPGVSVTYRRLDGTTYERDLVNALASGRGPDLFMMHSAWLPKHANKVSPPLPEQIDLKTFRTLFPRVVEQDFAPDEVVFALPLYLDTLALFYNKDYFDAKAVALSPRTWDEFQSLIPRLVELDSAGRILKSAAAIGGSDQSVNRATDILNLLMLQTGVVMVDGDFSSASFASALGIDSLRFYTSFANAANRYYTWNDSLHYSLDNFAQGNTAMMFNYSHQIGALKEKNPFLRFGITPMPQPAGSSQPVNFANYWGVTVSNQSRNQVAAWDFAIYLTTNVEAQRKYLNLTQKPPALLILIDQLLNDETWGVFAKQALTARSWPQIDNVAVETEFSNAIKAVIAGQKTLDKALQEAEETITELMRKSKR